MLEGQLWYRKALYSPGASNIRPAGHSLARQAFLSGPQSL